MTRNAYYVFAFDETWWNSELRAIAAKQRMISNVYRTVKGANAEGIGVCLISNAAKTVCGAALVKWSRPAVTRKRTVKLFDYRPLPETNIDDLGIDNDRFDKYTCVDARPANELPHELWHELVAGLNRRHREYGTTIAALEAKRRSLEIEWSDHTAQVLAQEKDAILLLCRTLDMNPELPFADPGELRRMSLVKHIAATHERKMVSRDIERLDRQFPGFRKLEVNHGFRFTKGKKALTVVDVGDSNTEKILGVDLYYYNEEYQSYTFIQYKRMNPRVRTADFVYQFEEKGRDELERMRRALGALPPDPPFYNGPREFYRLGAGAMFFFKFCPKIVYTLNDDALLPGLYVPMEYCYHCIDMHGPTWAVSTQERHLSNRTFLDLAKGGWIGSRGDATSTLRESIREFAYNRVEQGRRVLFASTELVSAVTATADTEELEDSRLYVSGSDSPRNNQQDRRGGRAQRRKRS